MNVVSMAINHAFIGVFVGVTLIELLLDGYFTKKVTATTLTLIAVVLVSLGMATPGVIMVITDTPLTNTASSFMLGALVLLILETVVFMAKQTFGTRMKRIENMYEPIEKAVLFVKSF